MNGGFVWKMKTFEQGRIISARWGGVRKRKRKKKKKKTNFEDEGRKKRKSTTLTCSPQERRRVGEETRV